MRATIGAVVLAAACVAPSVAAAQEQFVVDLRMNGVVPPVPAGTP